MNRFVAVVLAFLVPSSSALANECWSVSNIRGHAAHADQGYEFARDGLPNTVLICFTPEGGTVTGTDVGFVRFGRSTLAGYGGNARGNELFEVYQIDRQRGKLLYTKSRIGTKTIAPVLSDVVASYVGDARRVSK